MRKWVGLLIIAGLLAFAGGGIVWAIESEFIDLVRLLDDTFLSFGTDDDIKARYDETTDNRLEVENAAASSLATFTDNGGVGDLVITGTITSNGAFLPLGGIDLADDVAILFGNGDEFQQSFDSGNVRLEITDGTNILYHLTDAGTTGNGVYTGTLSSVGALSTTSTLTVTDDTTLGGNDFDLGDAVAEAISTSVGSDNEGIWTISSSGVTVLGKNTTNGGVISTDATDVSVSSGQEIGSFNFRTKDASTNVLGVRARSSAIADNEAFTDDDAPTAILFETTPDASTTLTTALKLRSNQGLEVYGPTADLGEASAGLDVTTDIGQGTGDWDITSAEASFSAEVGIATTAPDALLHVFDGSSGGGIVTSAAVIIEDDTDAEIRLVTPDTGTGTLTFGDDVAGNAGRIRYSHVDNEMEIRSGSSTVPLIVTPTAVEIDGDNAGLFLGEGQDASVDYDGTHMTFDSRVVGTGDYRFDNAAIHFEEITTPTAITNYGALYTKLTNDLFFQDGEGTEHLIHGESFSELWDHMGADGVTTLDTTMTNLDEFNEVTGWENVSNEDTFTRVVGNKSTGRLALAAVGAAGNYLFAFHGSLTVSAGGGSQELLIGHGITLNTKLVITDATNATPIVVTSTAHDLLNGDMVSISGVTGNTAANGDWIITNQAANTFELVALDGTTSVGNGAYISGGGVDSIYPGACIVHKLISTSDLDSMSSSCRHDLASSDEVSIFVANITSAGRTAQFAAIFCTVRRIGL